jgi:hypothetical protein
MPQARVTIDYVNQPNKNPKYGSIKTKEVGYVSVVKEALGQFTPNEVCTISYTTNPNGYHNLVQKMAGAGKPAAPAAPPSYSNNPGAAIMGLANKFVGRGDVPLDSKSIAGVINKCKAGYELSDLWPKPEVKPSLGDEMDDEIPY